MQFSPEECNRQILRAIAGGQRITQRSLAAELGVALGLTNLLIRRLVAKGYVRMAGTGTRHVRYLMTSQGWEALGRATQESLENTVRLYTETRDLIREGLAGVSSRSVPDEEGQKRVVFYGAGDVAEIAYVSLQRTDLTLVGVVDDKRVGRFFDLPILPSSALTASSLDGIAYSQLVVTSVRHAAAIRSRLEERGLGPHRVAYLQTSVMHAGGRSAGLKPAERRVDAGG